MRILRVEFVRSWRASALAVAIGIGAATTNAAPPELLITWSVNDGRLNEATPSGIQTEAGDYRYQGTDTDPETGLVLWFDLTGAPNAALDGDLRVFNDLEDEIEVGIEVTLPFSQALPIGSELAGMLVIGLTTDSGGGRIASLPPYLWQALIDDEVVGPSASLFGHLFEMWQTGSGQSVTWSDFGNPDPVPGPPIHNSIGFKINFSLTPLDLASFRNEFGSLDCLGDLDGNGTVGARDLTALLAEWGPCPPGPDCAADLNGDGTVGVADLLQLIAVWGRCSA